MLQRTDNRPVVDRLDLGWRSGFVLASETVSASERHGLAHAAAAGSLLRVRPGVYSEPDPDAREVDRAAAAIRALSIARPTVVASHTSAAALWRIPRLDRWPGSPEIVESAPYSRRSTAGVTRRRTSVPFDTEVIGGILTTDLDRTALDLARTDSVASAVASVDAALAGVRFADGGAVRADRDAMLAVLDSIPGQRGVDRARWVLGFADPLAELPGESLSRVQIHRLGLTPPVLQHCFEDDEGRLYPDFWWPEFGVAGEMDGRGKYLGPDAEFTRAAVLREKRREDRLRRMCDRVVRWDWATAANRQRLGILLRSAGVR